jgi:hypothetical protein
MSGITVEIPGPIAEKLRQLAEAEQRTETEIVCDALEAYLGTRRKLPTGTGKYHSGQPNVAQQAEDIVRRAVEEGAWP